MRLFIVMKNKAKHLPNEQINDASSPSDGLYLEGMNSTPLPGPEEGFPLQPDTGLWVTGN